MRLSIKAAALLATTTLAAPALAQPSAWFGQAHVTLQPAPACSFPFYLPTFLTGYNTQRQPIFVGQGTTAVPGGDAITGPFNGTPVAATGTYIAVIGSPGHGVGAGWQLAQPTSAFQMVWGTPDAGNKLSFYDATGNLIGTVGGQRLMDVFNHGMQPQQDAIRVELTRPASTIQLWYDNSAFEAGNVAFDMADHCK